jgi:protein SCO1/2
MIGLFSSSQRKLGSLEVSRVASDASFRWHDGKCLLALIVLLFATPAAAQQFDPFHEARIDKRIGAEIPLDGKFLDRTGKAVTLKQLANGKPLLLVPVLHECPNFCSVTLAGLTKAIEALPAGTAPFATVAFGIDPKEGPKQASADLARLEAQTGREAPPDTYALTGQAAAIHQVTDALGYRYAWDARIGQYAHAAAFAVITPSGRLSRWFYGLSPNPNELAQALQTAREDRVGGWAQQLLLICFHYDPNTGRYTPEIMKVLRLAGVLTMLAIGLVVFLAQRRRRA